MFTDLILVIIIWILCNVQFLINMLPFPVVFVFKFYCFKSRISIFILIMCWHNNNQSCNNFKSSGDIPLSCSWLPVSAWHISAQWARPRFEPRIFEFEFDCHTIELTYLTLPIYSSVFHTFENYKNVKY